MNPETPALTEKHAHTNLIPNQAKENPLDPLYQLKIWMFVVQQNCHTSSSNILIFVYLRG